MEIRSWKNKNSELEDEVGRLSRAIDVLEGESVNRLELESANRELEQSQADNNRLRTCTRMTNLSA